MCVFPQEIISLIISHINSQTDLYWCALVSQGFYVEAMPKLWRAPFDDEPFGENSIIDRLVIGTLQSDYQREPPLGHYVRNLIFGERLDENTDVNWISLLPFLENLEIWSAQNVSNTYMYNIFKQCPQITSFCLGETYFEDSDYVNTFKQFPQLTYLSLYTIFSDTSIIKFIPRYCRHLRELQIDLDNENELASESLIPLLESPLEQLDLSNCVLTDAEKTIKVIKRFNKLKKLDLYECEGINEQCIRQLLSTDSTTKPLPLLTSFTILSTTPNDPRVDDAVLIPFIQTHLHLERLDLNFCAITDLTLAMIPAALPRLSSLDITCNRGVTAQGVRQFVKKCTTLIYVNITGCELDPKDFPEADEANEIVRETTSNQTPLPAQMRCLRLNTIKRIRLASDLGSENDLQMSRSLNKTT